MSVSIPKSKFLPPADPADCNGAIPPLENGDRLSREEFMRRYEAMPHLQKAELIHGVVHVPSPVRHRFHGRQHAHLNAWLAHYEAATAGVEVSDNSTVNLDLHNVPQPDSVLFIQPEHGGRVKIDAEGYIVGAPTWSRRWPPAAPATTCTTSLTPIGKAESVSTWCGACWTVRSTGSCSVRSATNPSCLHPTAPCAAPCSLDFGSIRPLCCAAIWRRRWP